MRSFIYIFTMIMIGEATFNFWKYCNYNYILMTVLYAGTIMLFFAAALFSKLGEIIDNSKSIELKNISMLHSKTNNFLEVYKKLYKENGFKLEVKRIKINFYRIIMDFFFFLVCIGILNDNKPIYEIDNLPFIKFYEGFQNMYPTICIIFVISAIIYFLSKFNYTNEYKKVIIPNLIKLVNEKLEYSEKFEEKMKSDYKKAKFDVEEIDFYDEDDHIYGKLDENTIIQMADIKVKRLARSKLDYLVTELFKGIFAYIKTNVTFEKAIVVTAAEKQYAREMFLSKVEIDNREFERKFDVYCENRVLALRIFTADIMEEILEFSEKMKITFEMTFREDTINFRFYTGNMFEPRFRIRALDKNYIYSYYEILEFILNITKKINKSIKESNI